MNQALSFGTIGTFGAPKRRRRGRKRKKKRSKGEKSLRHKLFRKFAKEYGTRSFPAVSQERHRCIKAWLRDKEREGCRGVVGEMRQFEYLDWLKQGLKGRKFNAQEKKAARDILGRGKEEEAVHRKKGELDNDGEVITDDGSGPDPLLIAGGLAVLAGGWWWFYGRKKR
jgi:LPXTG-motif cell wall-anchored protein